MENIFSFFVGCRICNKLFYTAGCGEGYYYESTTKSCIACPLGTYQGNEVSFSCTQCPSGTMTRDPRSVSEHQCIGEFHFLIIIIPRMFIYFTLISVCISALFKNSLVVQQIKLTFILYIQYNIKS